MEKILSFLYDHLELCVACFVALITLLLQILKKKPVKVVDNAKMVILSVAPKAVNAVERSVLKGEEKLNYATQMILNYLTSEGYGRYSELVEQYSVFIRSVIENILSTPQKKGE